MCGGGGEGGGEPLGRVAHDSQYACCCQVEVNGPNMHPVYEFLRRELPEDQGGGGGHGVGQDLGWNFQVGVGGSIPLCVCVRVRVFARVLD